MGDMKVQQMTMADPRDWCTYAFAAEQLNVSMRTVARMIAEGKLTAYRPLTGSRESPRHKTLIYVPQLMEYKQALQRVRGDDVKRDPAP